ncbi:[4Fe-4S] cluster assembly scaffold protein Mrp (=ApbC) [hydrothermal vent metagenome]|uniref:[4Fe-4S] cluster assembly scaffold protein Mrp (=ApbC) n=1 Tax=hydrothermal vent metagenome TaxID=652676 RepID=A0A3B0WL46_9ZZZZ
MGFFSNLFGKKLTEAQQQEIKHIITSYKNPLDDTPLDNDDNDNTNNQESFLSSKAISALKLKKGTLNFTLAMPYPCKSLWPSIEQTLSHELTQCQDIQAISITFKTEITAHDAQKNISPLPNIKNIIAVASGKGGVGKSTTSVNLALALQQEGAKVGILDADIYGPSIPTMLNIKNKPASQDGKSMQPLTAYGLQVMSIGALIEEDSPMIWRGPIVTQTLTQLLKETNWQELDYLIIDLPPGTGDVQLTLSQQIPVTGAVIVTTPQPISVIDAKKALKMFEKVDIPILGIIENMATHICSQCQHEEAIFGAHGGEQMAKQYNVNFLGSLPLDKRIRESVDQGKPSVTAEPESNIAQKYRNMAHQISYTIGKQKRNYANVFPKIEILNT